MLHNSREHKLAPENQATADSIRGQLSTLSLTASPDINPPNALVLRRAQALPNPVDIADRPTANETTFALEIMTTPTTSRHSPEWSAARDKLLKISTYLYLVGEIAGAGIREIGLDKAQSAWNAVDSDLRGDPKSFYVFPKTTFQKDTLPWFEACEAGIMGPTVPSLYKCAESFPVSLSTNPLSQSWFAIQFAATNAVQFIGSMLCCVDFPVCGPLMSEANTAVYEDVLSTARPLS